MQTERIAEALTAARLSGRRTPAEAPADLAAAYAVQAAVAARCGQVLGFKTGRLPGTDTPIMAPIFEQRRSPARYEWHEPSRIGIELELGFRIDRPLPEPGGSGFAERAAACVSLVPAIEVVDTRLADPDAAPPLLKLADNQSNGGLVVGAPVREWRRLDLRRVTARLRLGETTVLDGAAEVPGGDAFMSFCALACRIGGHCGGLQPGQVVITGSLNGLPYVEREIAVCGEIRGVGTVAAHFAA